MMPFEPKKTRNKIKSAYKSIYLRQAVVDELNRLAAEHNTSFNNIVVTMIEQCLDDVKFNSIAVTMIEQSLENIKMEEEQEG